MNVPENRPSIPGIPFDPRKQGPADVLRSIGAALKRNSTVLVVVGGALLVAKWYFEVSIPYPPNWMLVGLTVGLLASGTAWSVGTRLAKALHTTDTVLLSEQGAASGDQRLVEVAPDRFRSMTVVNHNDKVRGREFLKEVVVNDRIAYEVDRYDPESNTAVASWMAGETNSQIRQEKAAIRRIKTSLESEADKAMELLANHPDILREQTAEMANYLVAVAEGVEVPSDGSLHERLSKLLDDRDPSDTLLGGGDGDPDRDDPDEEREQDLKQIQIDLGGSGDD